MSAIVWAVVICAAVFFIAVEAVALILKRRLRLAEAALERDFSAQVDRELPGFYEDEGE